MRNANQNPNNIPEPPMYFESFEEYWTQDSWIDRNGFILGRWIGEQRNKIKKEISNLFGIKLLSPQEKRGVEYDKKSEKMAKLGLERSFSREDYINSFQKSQIRVINPAWEKWHTERGLFEEMNLKVENSSSVKVKYF